MLRQNAAKGGKRAERQNHGKKDDENDNANTGRPSGSQRSKEEEKGDDEEEAEDSEEDEGDEKQGRRGGELVSLTFCAFLYQYRCATTVLFTATSCIDPLARTCTESCVSGLVRTMMRRASTYGLSFLCIRLV